MKLKDFLTGDELTQWLNLEMELLAAHNKKERTHILYEMDELLETARSRYKAYLAKEESSSSSCLEEMTLKPGYFIEFKTQEEINKLRREKTNNAYKELQKEVQDLLNENDRIVKKATKKKF